MIEVDSRRAMTSSQIRGGKMSIHWRAGILTTRNVKTAEPIIRARMQSERFVR